MHGPCTGPPAQVGGFFTGRCGHDAHDEGSAVRILYLVCPGRGSRAQGPLVRQWCPRIPPMPTRPILVRIALVTVLLAGLVVLADSVARHELTESAGETAFAPVTEVAPITGTIR
jgi:hypothetical protein